MKIVIGKTSEVGFENRPNLTLKDGGEFPVRVLHMRQARSHAKKFLQGKEISKNPDPINAKILIVLVQDGNRLPSDIDRGNYQLRLKIVSENNKTTASSPPVPRKNGFNSRV